MEKFVRFPCLQGNEGGTALSRMQRLAKANNITLNLRVEPERDFLRRIDSVIAPVPWETAVVSLVTFILWKHGV